MDMINIHEAKTHLSRLVERAGRGETIVIAKAGRPMARLVPIGETPPRRARRLGFLAEAFRIPEDFDRMGEEEIGSLFGAGR